MTAQPPVRDFFALQDRARRSTRLLIVLFGLAVILIILAIFAIISAVVAYTNFNNPLNSSLLLLYTALAVLSVILSGTLYKINQLKSGGNAVAAMLGARPLTTPTTDSREKILLNIVDEMAIAAGTPVPSVYILPEASINAFAAGFSPADAIVCITQGALTELTRDELQGVVAHEFSHILNGDMRLNIRLMGFIHGILVIGQIGNWILRGSGRSNSRSKKGSGAAILILAGLGLLIVGYIGTFFGNCIKAAINRAREFLSDASAVQFTRNPGGLSGALKKICGQSRAATISHHNAPLASHLFFASGVSGFWQTLFATHPPIIQRIRAIDHDFDGIIPATVLKPVILAAQAATALAPESRLIPESPVQPHLSSALLFTSAGTFSPAAMTFAKMTVDAIPANLRMAMYDNHGAQAVLFLLTGSTMIQQAIAIAATYSPEIADRMRSLAVVTGSIDYQLRIPTCQLAIASLRSLSTIKGQQFNDVVCRIIELDHQVDTFEFMLLGMIRRQMAAGFSPSQSPMTVRAISSCRIECMILLSILCKSGNAQTPQIERAFTQALSQLSLPEVSIATLSTIPFATLDRALQTLSGLVPLEKRKLLCACITAVESDGVVTQAEAELLRATALSLGVPIPLAVA